MYQFGYSHGEIKKMTHEDRNYNQILWSADNKTDPNNKTSAGASQN